MAIKNGANLGLFDTTCITPFESEVRREMQERLIKIFLDQIIISAIANNSCTKAMHIMSLIKINYDISLSPGTLYSTLDVLEQRGMIKKIPNHHKIYTSTTKGQKTLDAFKNNIGYFQNTLLELTQKVSTQRKLKADELF